jgi:hypothetical protein
MSVRRLNQRDEWMVLEIATHRQPLGVLFRCGKYVVPAADVICNTEDRIRTRSSGIVTSGKIAGQTEKLAEGREKLERGKEKVDG